MLLDQDHCSGLRHNPALTKVQRGQVYNLRLFIKLLVSPFFSPSLYNNIDLTPRSYNPDILILDEPANGLDPAGIVEIRELLLDLARNHGVTIFISSHILGEISRFATRIGIIHEGRLIEELYINHLENLRKRRLLVNMQDKKGAASSLAKAGFSADVTEEGFLEITGRDGVTNPEKINSLLVNAGYPPAMLKVEEEDLEAYFLRVINNRGA